MNEQEQKRVDEVYDTIAREHACDKEHLRKAMPLGIIDGEVVPISERGFHRMSRHANVAFMDVKEAVEALRVTHTTLFRNPAIKPDAETIAGMLRKDFEALRPAARMQLGRRAGLELQKVQKPRTRAPTVAEQAELAKLPAIERMRRARQMGVA